MNPKAYTISEEMFDRLLQAYQELMFVAAQDELVDGVDPEHELVLKELYAIRDQHDIQEDQYEPEKESADTPVLSEKVEEVV